MSLNPPQRIILALDVDTLAAARDLTRELAEHIGGIKLNIDLMTTHGATILVRRLKDLGVPIFCDTRFQGPPDRIGKAVGALAEAGASFATVCTTSGRAVMEPATVFCRDMTIVGVTTPTWLTTEEQSRTLRLVPEAQSGQLACLAYRCGVRHIFVSASHLRECAETEQRLFVCGIQPYWSPPKNKTSMKPREAMAAGADYLVIGNALRNPPEGMSRIQAAQHIAEEIRIGLEQRTRPLPT